MVDVTSFLLRWLYLSNLVRDVAEIQTLPYQPMQMQSSSQYPHNVNGVIHAALQSRNDINPQLAPITARSPVSDPEEEWKDRCLRGILSYPPGTQRMYAMDTLRLELVQQFARHLRASDSTVKRYSTYCHRIENNAVVDRPIDDDDDPYLDADLEIVRAFEQATSVDHQSEETAMDDDGSNKEAVLVISDEGANVIDSDCNVTLVKPEEPTKHTTATQTQTLDDEIPSEDELEHAYSSLANFRDYLPQLMSAVLMSPGSLQPALLDPVQKFRRMLMTRCLQDANWGIELCWLLEAEVGRAWKTLFEHRQQTGRRLIIVLPAEKAAVLAKIGTAKRAAFELLQDAEQATAYGYGYTFPSQPGIASNVDPDLEPNPARLPSSLSLRRCSHFGDTMHFIDRLTQISLDLRMVPTIQRHQCLLDSLNEINRRLRRRMITRGDVSLDVEDNRGPEEWPHTSDMTVDMLKYSLHFPLEPQGMTWPGGEGHGEKTGSAADRAEAGVMRVLNIVTPECRILSSRERCPYMVHLEVAETGMEGSDARLYASGARGLGTTIGESLAMPSACTDVHDEEDESLSFGQAFPTYKIPSELLATPISALGSEDASHEGKKVVEEFRNLQDAQEDDIKIPSRGGWQADEYYQQESFDASPSDMMRQQQYEQLHQQLMTQAPPPMPPSIVDASLPTLSTAAALLDKVFGLPWDIKCEQIRQASPYGKVKGWRLASFIMKAGEDIRREALVMQVIAKLDDWFQTDIPESHRPKMRPYTIMCAGGDAGILEVISDAKSVDEIKKKTDGFSTLREYFERAYGSPQYRGPQRQYSPYQSMPQGNHATGDGTGITFEVAQDNFLRSLVGYSLVCYILQIKDRHNANILMDREGHIMHIDFGYVLGDTPKMAKVPIFSERAPFKLSGEFWEVLGGWNYNNGGLGVKFCKMFELAFACASAHSDEIVSLVEAALMNLTRNPNTARTLANGIRHRLRMRGPPGSVEQKTFVMDLVNTALTSWGTTTYDWLQKNMNGYQ